MRDRVRAAVQAFCEGQDLRARLDVSEYERSLAEQVLELKGRECEGLRRELDERDSQMRFLYARADAQIGRASCRERV